MRIQLSRVRPLTAARWGLTAVAGVVCLVAAIGLAGLAEGGPRVNELLKTYAAAKSEAKTTDGETGKADSDGKTDEQHPAKLAAERVTKRSLFCAVKKKKFSAGKLVGVIGHFAMFEGSDKLLKVGDDRNGGKITAIGGDWVEVTFEGKAEKLHVFGEGGPSSGPSGPSRSMMARRGPPGGGRMVVASEPAPPPSHSRSLPPDFKLTPEMIEKFKALSPEQQKQALEHVPPEIREQLDKALKE